MASDRARPGHPDPAAEEVRPPLSRPKVPAPTEVGPQPAPLPTPTPIPLPEQRAAAALRGRGLRTSRTALLLGLQQTHGNRAVQRYLQRSAAADAPSSASVGEDLADRIRGAGGGQALEPRAQRRL